MPDTLTLEMPIAGHARAANDLGRHVRAATAGAREFSGIGVPWDEEIEIWGWREKFAPGSIEDSAGAKVFWRHAEPIGKLTAEANTAEGWDVTGILANTARGDEAYTLLQEGVIDRLSIRFEPIEWTENAETGVITYTRARVLEVSLVPFPAYAGAEIRNVRSAPTTTNPERATVPNDTLTRAELDSALDAQSAEFTRGLDARLAAFSRSAEPAGLAWQTPGAYLKALARGEEGALEFHRQLTDPGEEGDKFRRAYTGGTLADTNPQNTWISDAVRLVEKRRKVINRFSRQPLPAEGNVLEYAKVATNTITVGTQAAEGEDLAFGKLTIGSDTTNVYTKGGYTTLSRQQIERSSINFLTTVNRAQQIAYAADTEDGARTALAAVITGNRGAAGTRIDTPALAAMTPADWLDAIVEASERLEDGGFVLSGAYVSKDVFKTLYRLNDTAGRPVFDVDNRSAEPTVGTVDVKGLGGSLAKVTFEVLPGAAAGTTAFFDEVGFTTFESAGAPWQLQDENIVNLTKAFSVYGYVAYASEFPGAILPTKPAAA